MKKTDQQPGSSVRELAEQGAPGFAAREVRRSCVFPPPDRGVVRKALKKVGADRGLGKKSAGQEAIRRRAAVKPEAKRQERVLQATLGMIADDLEGPAALDDARLQARLAKMSGADLDRLARLVAQVRTGNDAGAASRPVLERVRQRLSEGGFTLEVNGDNNAITISMADPPRGQKSENGRRDYGGDMAGDRRDGSTFYFNWGRQLSRIRHFIEGR